MDEALTRCLDRMTVNYEIVRIKEKLLFARGILSLLQETELFNLSIDKAVKDIDDLIDAANESFKKATK